MPLVVSERALQGTTIPAATFPVGRYDEFLAFVNGMFPVGARRRATRIFPSSEEVDMKSIRGFPVGPAQILQEMWRDSVAEGARTF